MPTQYKHPENPERFEYNFPVFVPVFANPRTFRVPQPIVGRKRLALVQGKWPFQGRPPLLWYYLKRDTPLPWCDVGTRFQVIWSGLVQRNFSLSQFLPSWLANLHTACLHLPASDSSPVRTCKASGLLVSYLTTQMLLPCNIAGKPIREIYATPLWIWPWHHRIGAAQGEHYPWPYEHDNFPVLSRKPCGHVQNSNQTLPAYSIYRQGPDLPRKSTDQASLPQ